MKKQKVNLKKLTLRKKTISNMETIHGGEIEKTKFIVICTGLINTTVITTTATVVTTTNWPPIDPPPIISKDYKTCLTDCVC